MRRRPVLLFVCALTFLYFPGELIWRAAAGGVILPGDVLFSFLLPLVLLVGLIRVTKVGWYSLVAFGGIWGARDLFYYYSSQGAELTPILIHMAIYMVSMAYFINPRIRHLYFDPKMRWWRAKPRYETHGPSIVKVNLNDQWDYPVMRNISEGGCFLETPHLLKVNDEVEVSIPLPVPLNVSVIKTRGRIRWCSESHERNGMGIQFQDLSRASHKALRTYVRRQL